MARAHVHCFNTDCGVKGRLSFGASLWSALEYCDFDSALRLQSLCVCVPHSSRMGCHTDTCATMCLVCCSLSRVAGNDNWGTLGAESVADLLHHAPELQQVDIAGAPLSMLPSLSLCSLRSFASLRSSASQRLTSLTVDDLSPLGRASRCRVQLR